MGLGNACAAACFPASVSHSLLIEALLRSPKVCTYFGIPEVTTTHQAVWDANYTFLGGHDPCPPPKALSAC